MTIRTIIANTTAAFARVAGFAQQVVGIDAGRVWGLAPAMPFYGTMWSKHLPVCAMHNRSGLCTRDLTDTQAWNYSVGACVSERTGRRRSC
ncbi:hypothetical protein [Pseudochelatococcus sp. G4_1912]|uniref:hypothetical protein n=1 Tax=Pseudochelatococcus sp. G4_1912 TaxID=3114288 RepID=UPI0039C5E540